MAVEELAGGKVRLDRPADDVVPAEAPELPREGRRVYEHPFRSKLPRVSAVDPDAPDYDRFPRFRSAEKSVFDLAPGELLYLPGGWWHHVRSLEESFSINWWWASGLTWALVTAADLYKWARSVRL